MHVIELDQYKRLIKLERDNFFKPPYDFVYNAFIELEYYKYDNSFFRKNASEIVEKLREECWKEFLLVEKDFTSLMLKKLMDSQSVSKMTAEEAITWFAETYPEHIYALNLSNTQSRRSRAGKEFECIIELLLMGAGIPMDTQGNLGKSSFISKGLGKLVDAVSPGVTEYEINKRNTVLISAKTTLRERWQEVPEEMGRTGAREMFLSTLDSSISKDVLNTLYEANIQLTTTKSIKETRYASVDWVLSFEQLLDICSSTNSHWNDYSYSVEQCQQIIDLLTRQISKHVSHEYVKNAYENRLKYYQEKIDSIH